MTVLPWLVIGAGVAALVGILVVGLLRARRAVNAALQHYTGDGDLRR